VRLGQARRCGSGSAWAGGCLSIRHNQPKTAAGCPFHGDFRESCYSFPACRTGTIRNLLQNPEVDWRPGKVSAMAMQSKGSRRMYATRIPVEVGDLIERRALEAGCTSTSQYLADLLAVVHGRPDLVRELNQEVMPLTA
jgi:hypothetical protein